MKTKYIVAILIILILSVVAYFLYNKKKKAKVSATPESKKEEVPIVTGTEQTTANSLPGSKNKWS